MPYIKEEARFELNECIDNVVQCIGHGNKLSDNDLLVVAGEINYVLTRIITKLIGSPSYSKIAIASGVLDNVKQEFYRRYVATYENDKILENGDIVEFLAVKTKDPLY